MKLIQKIIQISRTLLISCCLLTSCNYLDVIPPAQADFDDTMKDEAATLNSCLLVTAIFPVYIRSNLKHSNNLLMNLYHLRCGMIINNK